ncbi:hypothetical protein K402DRAFT_63130 [Aulographum hederae CBS 113979]|uniref:Uncharacterized protein n=1 Tax=Aulographum hederae CBS 113979 TaxID=1176131 RepID=A0A6G1H200_9PEZI|nr:hypothetical protein K402DRAFT_63130 [Aulographum hederae CBS 113979]
MTSHQLTSSASSLLFHMYQTRWLHSFFSCIARRDVKLFFSCSIPNCFHVLGLRGRERSLRGFCRCIILVPTCGTHGRSRILEVFPFCLLSVFLVWGEFGSSSVTVLHLERM